MEKKAGSVFRQRGNETEFHSLQGGAKEGKIAKTPFLNDDGKQKSALRSITKKKDE